MQIVRGVWSEICVIPVLLWSYAGLTVGTGLAFRTGHKSLPLYTGALVLGVLIQGLLAHCTNEVVDWRPGTDRHEAPRVLSGGSKVVVLGLIGQRGMLELHREQPRPHRSPSRPRSPCPCSRVATPPTQVTGVGS